LLLLYLSLLANKLTFRMNEIFVNANNESALLPIRYNQDFINVLTHRE